MTELPTREAILRWIADNPGATAKRDIARAFGLKGADRIPLKALLKELQAEGHLEKKHHKFREPARLPPVSVVEVGTPHPDGGLICRPLEWEGEGDEPAVLLIPRDSDPAVGPGDRLLVRLAPVTGEDHHYEARLIRRIGANPLRIVGIYRDGRIMPIDKGEAKSWVVPEGHRHGAEEGELVEAEQAGPKGRLGLPKARITRRLGDPSAPRAVSLIAIHQHAIPDHFPDAAVAEADAAKPATLRGRRDLRDLPFVTIDPADARDRDDAVLAIPEPEGGFTLWVAIADVAHYVRPQSALDDEARRRGNSTYFPDRVVPMLPDRLSGDLCSLHQGVARAVIAVRMRIDDQGRKLAHDFHRAMIRSAASLAYEQVQAAVDGHPDEATGPLLDAVLRPLFAAYAALARARGDRQPLDLDLPERRIDLSEAGKVTSVAYKDRLDAHRLIEEFMVLANVAAAETLADKRTPLLYRVHEAPDPQKIEALREVAEGSGLTLAKGQVIRTMELNRLLAQAAGTDQAELINLTTLRSMQQAYYAPQNFGHFGLALRNYAHFTSPIRRYADLIVHRALIAAHGWGKDGLSPEDIARLDLTAEQISDTERRSMAAERDTTDRYLALYLADRVGTEMAGRISGVQRFGLFVKLDETGADVLVPVRSLGAEFFHFDARSQTLMGADSGQVIGAGQRALVRLAEVTPETGGLTGELVSLDDRLMARGPSGRPGKAPRRKLGQARAKAAKERKRMRRRT
jgi:ribonuclease R